MVREIIHVQVGQCGNQIGNTFWTTMCAEHRLAPDGKFKGKQDKPDDLLRLDKIDVYYAEAGTMRFVPRATLVDLEPGIIDVIKASPMGSLFKPDNMCFGASGAGNNWAKGHYTEGAELIDEAVDIIRRETEGCDCPQGFQLTQSIGGGTGSGMGTLLLLKIRDNYPDRITATFSVYPSPKVSDVVVEPYNATLSIHQLLENSDETFVIDNEALFSISHNVLKQKEPKYADLNWVISMVMSGITASLRFSGKLNGDLRKMGVNLVPFPRLHFFLLAQAPLFAPGQGSKVKLTVQELTDQMWSSRNFLANVKSEDGKYLTASCGYRGQIATQEVDDEVAKIQQKMADDFVTWIPNNIKSSIIIVPPEGCEISGTFVANTTAIKGVFQRISAQFAKMYKRKAFLHWYKGEGMDEMEFQEADKNVRDLITEYQDKQDAVVDLENEDDEDDEDDEDEDGDEDEDEDGGDEEDAGGDEDEEDF
jgi:tubulin beta